MAGVIADAVFDAALAVVAASTRCQVRKSSSAVLVSVKAASGGTSLDGSNFTAPGNYSSGSSTGRYITCLSSSGSDMKAISVSSAGAAKKVAIGKSSGSAQVDYVVAVLTSAVSLGASDQINLGTFSVILLDPS